MKQFKFSDKERFKALGWFTQEIARLPEGKAYMVEIKEHRAKRSLDANAYCWVLIDKLAIKLHKTLKQDKEEVKAQIYRRAIKDIGGVSITSCLKSEAVDMFKKAWASHGMGWQVETFPSKIEGCTNVTAYYGSSVYDTAQMSRLIDSIVQECKEQGIETMTPNELEVLKAQWR